MKEYLDKTGTWVSYIDILRKYAKDEQEFQMLKNKFDSITDEDRFNEEMDFILSELDKRETGKFIHKDEGTFVNILGQRVDSKGNIINQEPTESQEIQTAINNEYDYSNIVASAANIGSLVQYCENVYNQLTNLIEEDERKNEQLKQEYRNYTWKKNYGMRFEVSVRQKNFNSFSCKTLGSYMDALRNNQLSQVSSLTIDLDLSFKRGEGLNLNNHEHSFKIIFKPYEISFIRKSNYNDPHMNQVEENLKSILSKFQVANSIFCTK